ncbi:hypothetical protein ACFL6R_03990 [Gemmatimonadota bacterium]
MKISSLVLNRYGVVCGVWITMAMFLPGNPVSAQGREVPLHRDTDLLITVDHRGTAGYHFVNWNRDGLYTGVRFSLIRPRGERVLWSVHHAVNQELSTFAGFSREQYVELHGGFAWHNNMLNAVLLTGIGIVRERRFREFHDEDMGEGHEFYHVRDRMNQRYLLDLQLGVYHRGEKVNIGLGFSLATKSLNILFGFPVSIDEIMGR